MKKISECRVLIIDELGNAIEFPSTIGKQHQECIDEYARNKNYDYSNVDYVVDKQNILFYNANNNIAIAFMPKSLSDEQLELLDRMTLKMNDIDYMEVRKSLENGFEKFTLTNNVGKEFSDIVIQSYFKKTK